jgi:hypothetical protein
LSIISVGELAWEMRTEIFPYSIAVGHRVVAIEQEYDLIGRAHAVASSVT